jgi:hypothetical protein
LTIVEPANCFCILCISPAWCAADTRTCAFR